MEKIIFYTNALPIYRQVLYEKLYSFGWAFYVGDRHKKSDVLFGIKNINYKLFKTSTIGKLKYTRFSFQKDAAKVLINLDRSDLGFWLILLRSLVYLDKEKIYLWGHILYEKDSRFWLLLMRLISSRVNKVFSYGEYPVTVIGRKNVVQTYNGVLWERPAFLPASGRRDKIIYIGRNSRVKKLGSLIEFCENLGYNLDVVSPDIIYSESSHVNYCGYLKGEDLREFLRKNDYLAMVSLGNAGLNSIEASLSSIPTISHWNLETNMPEIEHLECFKDLFLSKCDIAEFRLRIDYLKGLSVEEYRDLQYQVYSSVEKWTVKNQWSIFKMNLYEA